jgi:DNA repair ATPase RecN
MLEKIEIKNFQSHKHTILDLSKGINVITGTSDVGKSSIRRAIEWLQSNRPRGTAFIRSGAKTPTEVSMKFDGTTVTRTKSKSKNSYALGKTEFNVVKTDVPNEITKFLNIDAVSVQGQHEKYFLLQDTSGEVAKKLNKVAGFEIIDQVMKSVKVTITKNKTDIKYAQEHIDGLEEDIVKYEHLDGVEEQLSLINKTLVTHQEKDNLNSNIKHTLNEITNIEGTIADLNVWLAIDTDITPILNTITSLTEKQENLTTIDELLSVITSYTKRIRKLSDRAECETEIISIDDLILQRDTHLRAYKTLVMALQNIENSNKLHTNLINELAGHEAQLDLLLKKHRMCPFCGTKLTTKTAAHIKELI